MLERYHAVGGEPTLDELLGLLDAGWRRGGFGDSDEERQLHAKATHALQRYHERFRDRGRRAGVVRAGVPVPPRPAHRCAAASTASTGCPTAATSSSTTRPAGPKTAAQLREDVQLSLYAVGAREAWELEAGRPGLPLRARRREGPGARDDVDRDWIAETVTEVADGILGQGFEPTPSYAACSMCDYRIVCPAAEK